MQLIDENRKFMCFSSIKIHISPKCEFSHITVANSHIFATSKKYKYLII